MYNAFKLAIPALIISVWLGFLPAAQAQTPTTEFNFFSTSNVGLSPSHSHLNGFLDDPTTDVFLGCLGMSLAINWVDSANSHHNSDFTPLKINLPSTSVGTLGKSQSGLGGVPGAVPELSTNISLGLLLALGLGSLAVKRRAESVK